MSDSESSKNLLLEEYKECFDNYIYRDELASKEFYYSLMIIAALIGITQYFGEKLGFLGALFISFVGLFALHILHVDLMSISSCKRAAIERALEIEDQLGYDLVKVECKLGLNRRKYVLQLAHNIGNRKKHLLENLLRPTTTGYFIIWFVRILIIMWLLYSFQAFSYFYKLG